MMHTQVAGGVVVNERGEILVTNQGGLTWSLPKGHIDDGETARAAAEREIFEETGVQDVTFVRELGSYDRHRTALSGGDDPSELKTITMFLFHIAGVPALAPVDTMHPEARWVPRHEVVALLTHRKDKEFFEHVVGKI